MHLSSSVNLHSKNDVVFSYTISRRSYIHKVLCSEGHMLYVQKIFVQKVLCSDGLLFRRSYVWKVLCSEGPVFRRSLFRRPYVGTHFHLSVSARNIVLLDSLVSGMKHFFISVNFTFLFHFLHNCIIHFFLRYTRLRCEDPTFSELQISKFQELGNPNESKLLFRCSDAPSSSIGLCVLCCVFFIID